MQRRQLDHRSDRPLYRQIADDLREQIEQGELTPGEVLPGLPALAGVYGVGKETARKGLAAIENEGLIKRDRGFSYEVAERVETVTVDLGPGETAKARPATAQDRDNHDVPEGAYILVVSSATGEKVYLADRTEIRYGES